jgi:hypothetical protein
MELDLPADIAAACRPLFEALPLKAAMPVLQGGTPVYANLVEQALSNPALVNRPELEAGLWLYAGDIYRSHTVSQGILNSTGSYWHGIMHRLEGDFSNSHYWMRQASGHPLRKAMAAVGLDADDLVDLVAWDRGRNSPDLVEKQRQEWAMLFEWCAKNA